MKKQDRILYAKDCLAVLENDLEKDSVDLIYLDPPFNSNRSYNLLYKTYYRNKQPVEAFKDTWEWSEHCDELMEKWRGSLEDKLHIRNLVALICKSVQPDYKNSKDCLPAYLLYMAERLILMWSILKETGSIYLHCDPTASHYLKMLMDIIFLKENFKNEIVWGYSGNSKPEKDFPKKHDIILRYSKTGECVFHPIVLPYKEATLKRYNHTEKDGRRYKISALKDGKQEKVYMSEGVYCLDWISDIPVVRKKEERLGYPTQKPFALLERIIDSSSNPGDVIFDPFCGCGTSIHAAEKLKRKWIGVDIAPFSTGLVRRRLLKNFPALKKNDILMRGSIETVENAHDRLEPQTLEARLDFEKEMCGLVGCLSIHKGRRPGDVGGDDGIDGVIEIDLLFKEKGKKTYKKEKRFAIVQVKSGKVTVDSVKAFNHMIDEDAETIAGVFVCFKKYQKTVEDALTKKTFKDGFGEYPVAQAYYVEEILDPNAKDLNLPLYGDQRALFRT